jgi:hypothetical protein
MEVQRGEVANTLLTLLKFKAGDSCRVKATGWNRVSKWRQIFNG